MAGRKEHEVLFMLNAALNGNFKSTFSNAQSEFTKLSREIQDLHKLQGNVSSYQKQEQAIAATTAKLSNLQQQHDLLQKEINETTGSTAGLEREKLKLEQRIKDTETALERQKQKLDTTKQKLQEAGVDTKNLAQADARLTEQLKELQAQQDRAADSASNFGTQAVQGFEAVQSAIVAAGIADKLNEIKDAYMECVSVAANFEESMSNVEALSGSNTREMAELTATAKELGATTKYTALQSADAMGYMGMAGWNAQQMMSGMDGVINLAAASGEDLARVSDIVTDNLTAFGLKAEDTAHFSDVLAAAATKSNTDVSIMGETFKQSASIAGALGYSIEDVAVGVGLMANAGVKGSIAGTALKNTFNGLLEGATLTSAAFGEYEFTAIKADGTMKDFASTIDELRVYFDQMTVAERVNNAMALAGQRGYNGLLAILNATDEDYASLTNSINNCSGAAQRMADIKMDNLNGQLTLMNSAWEAVQTTIGEQFNPELRTLAEIGTDVLGWVNTFIQEHPALVKGIMAGVGALGAGVAVLTGVATVTKVLIPLMGTLTAAIPGVNIIVGVTAAIAGVTAAVVGLHEAAKNSLDDSWELTAASREQYEQLQELNAEYEQTVEQFGETSYEAQSLRWQIEDLTAEYENGLQTLEEYQAAHESLMESYQDMAASHADATDGIDTERDSVMALIQKLGELTVTSDSVAQNQEAILAIIDRLNEAMPNLALSYDGVVSGSGAFIDSLYEMAKAQADAKKMAADYEEYVDRVGQQGNLKAAREDAAEQARLAQEDYEAAMKAYTDAASLYKYDTTGFGLYFGTRDEAAAVDAAKAQLDSYNAILEETTAAYEENEAALNELEGIFQDYHAAQEEAANAAPTLESTIASVRTQIEQLTVAYNEAYTAAAESISGQYNLWDEAAEVVATSASSINAALESQISYWEHYNANLQALGDRSTEIAGLSDMIATFADGSAESVNAIAGMANASDEDLQKMVANWQELQTQQSETSESLAELVTGFPEQIEQLVTAMEDGVEGMSLPDEAEESARNTIQAFIDEAETMLPVVQEAYATLGKAAADALGVNLSVTTSTRDSVPVPPSVGAYASGTSNAPPGWAWVGEEGPELIRMRGGETVLPAAISKEFALLNNYKNEIAAYAGGTDNVSAVTEEAAKLTKISNDAYASYNAAAYNNATYNSASYQENTPEAASAIIEAIPSIGDGGFDGPIKVEVHIHLEGSATPETVQALEDYVRRGELQEAVADAMENIQTDARRGAYV